MIGIVRGGHKKTCGCYNNTDSRSAIFFQKDVDVLNLQYVLTRFRHALLGSNKLSPLCLAGGIPTNTELFQFDSTTQYSELLDWIEHIW